MIDYKRYRLQTIRQIDDEDYDWKYDHGAAGQINLILKNHRAKMSIWKTFLQSA